MPANKTALSCLLTCCLIGGCTSEPTSTASSTHDADSHGHHAESFATAASELVALRDKIRDGFAAGDIDAAHGPLHEVGHILEQLSGLATSEGFTESDQESVKVATEKLFDAFGAVDKTLHGGDGSTYEEEAATIDQNTKIIADLANVDAAGAVKNQSTDAMPEPIDAVQPIDAAEPIDALAPIDAAAPTDVPAPAL